MKPLTLLIALILAGATLDAAPVPGSPPFETPAGNLQVSDDACTTSGNFDSKTRVTFYGDSRMGFVNEPLYGGASMDFYLGADSAWNVQNFGHEGWDSTNLRDHLKKCLHASGKERPDYWITDQIVFHQGGNDYIHNWLTIVFMPWKITDVTNGVLNNMEVMISMFQRRGKHMILVGNYPAMAYSLKYHRGVDWKSVGISWSDPWVGIWPLPTGPTSDVKRGEQWDQLKENFSAALHVHFEMVRDLGKYLGPGFGGDLAWAEERVFGHEPKTGPYWSWLAQAMTLATPVSLGMLQLETAYPEMVNRRAANGADIEYLPVWPAFQYGDEPWVANPGLLRDWVHPNPFGFLVWGSLVGDRVRAKGWNTAGGVVDPMPAPPPNDTVPVDGENSTRPSDPAPNNNDWILLCFLAGICHL